MRVYLVGFKIWQPQVPAIFSWLTCWKSPTATGRSTVLLLFLYYLWTKMIQRRYGQLCVDNQSVHAWTDTKACLHACATCLHALQTPQHELTEFNLCSSISISFYCLRICGNHGKMWASFYKVRIVYPKDTGCSNKRRGVSGIHQCFTNGYLTLNYWLRMVTKPMVAVLHDIQQLDQHAIIKPWTGNRWYWWLPKD